VQVFIKVEAARQPLDLEGALEKEPKAVLHKQIFFESCCLVGNRLQAILWWLLSCCSAVGPLTNLEHRRSRNTWTDHFLYARLGADVPYRSCSPPARSS